VLERYYTSIAKSNFLQYTEGEVSGMKTAFSIILLFIIFSANVIYAQGSVLSSLQGGIDELNRGYDEWNIERFHRAEEIFEGASKRAPDNYLPYYWKGVAQFHMILFYYGDGKQPKDEGKREESIEAALATLEQAIALNADDSESYALLGVITGMKIAEKPVSAVWLGSKVMKYKKKALESDPENPRVHYLTGTSYYYAPGFLGGREKSLEHFLKAEELYEREMGAGKDPVQPQWGYSACLAFTAKVYAKAGEGERAEVYYTKALRVNPNDKLAQKGLAELKEMPRK
jgi:tetratricopeptide (TPR) repeat protein